MEDRTTALPETLEQIAERIMREHDCNQSPTTNAQTLGRWDLKASVLSALRNERERCAKVAEAHLSDYRNNLSASSVAAAIREGR